MSEHHIVVGRTARYFTLGSLSSATREVWIVLHGYAQLAEHFLRAFRPIDDGSRLIVAPEALSRFYRDGTHGHVGASWMTKVDRDREIADYVAYLDALADEVLPAGSREAGAAGVTSPASRDDVRLVVLGFSQGVATAARWACRGRHRADAIVLWGGHLPPEIDLVRDGARLNGLRSVLGSRDEYRDETSVTREHERLQEARIPFESIEFDGTHRIETEPLLRLAAGIRAAVRRDLDGVRVDGR